MIFDLNADVKVRMVIVSYEMCVNVHLYSFFITRICDLNTLLIKPISYRVFWLKAHRLVRGHECKTYFAFKLIYNLTYVIWHYRGEWVNIAYNIPLYIQYKSLLMSENPLCSMLFY